MTSGDPSNTHPDNSAFPTTKRSSSHYPVRQQIEALVEGLASPRDFASKSENQALSRFQVETYNAPGTAVTGEDSKMSSEQDSSALPAIRQYGPDSLGPRAKDKVVIITGANSPLGIGRASAHQFARHGAKAVYITDAFDDHLEQHKQELNKLYPKTEIQTLKLDVSDEEAVARLCKDAVIRYGRLDIMFANAGVSGGPVPYDQISSEEFMDMMKINALGVFLCFKHAAAAMKHTSPSKAAAGGSLIGTASVAGLRSNAGGTHYSASKAAVVSMVQTFAYQLVGTNIRANAICPGLTETGMTAPVFEFARAKGTERKIGQLNPLRRGAVADEVARVALFLGSDESSYVNGQAWAVCGGLSAGHPFVPGKLA